MNDKWEGFTQEEILNISNQKYQYTKDVGTSSSPVKKTNFKQSRFAKKNITRERMLKTHQNKPLASGVKQPALPQEAKLFIPQIPEEAEVEIKVKSAKVILPPSSEPKPSSDLSMKNNSHPSVLLNNHSESASELNTSDDLLMSNRTSVLPDNPSESSSELKTANDLVRNNTHAPVLLTASGEANLEDFERRQKMMEEQNRKRKALLKKALEDRTKKTHEEALRLSEIEQELKKLDIQLSNDVSILRKQIEVATLELTDAQKRFDRAEQEYLDAKLALFTKRERKELLTAHLCTIIEQNELRKAKKLSDLMDKLQLGSVIIEKPMEVPVEKKEESIEPKESSDKPIPNESPSSPS